MRLTSFIAGLSFVSSFLVGSAWAEQNVAQAVSASVGAQAAGARCLADYDSLRTHYGVMSGLVPVAGAGAMVGGAMFAFSYEYGGMAGLSTTLGVAGNVLIGTVIPLAIVAATVGYETYSVVRFIESNHGVHLLQDVYGTGDGETFQTLVSEVQEKAPEAQPDRIRQMILEADQREELCNGVWKDTTPSNEKLGLTDRVALISDIERHLIGQFTQ